MNEQKIDYIDVNSEKSTAERKIFYVDVNMGDIKERIIKELKKKV